MTGSVGFDWNMGIDTDATKLEGEVVLRRVSCDFNVSDEVIDDARK
jgi:hypothetical protein